MLSRLYTGWTSRSLHSLHQNPRVNVLQQTVLRHGLPQMQASSSYHVVSLLRSVKKTLPRDDARKCFVRFLTDEKKTHPSGGSSELQTLVPWQSGVKEHAGRDGEVKLKVPVGNALAKRPFWASAHDSCSLLLSITDHHPEPTMRLYIPNTEKKDGDHTNKGNTANKDGDSSAGTSKKVGVVRKDSKKYPEVYSVVIKRRATKVFLQQLQRKIDVLHSGSVPIPQVKVLLTKRAFLSAPPEKLVTVVELLAEFFKSKNVAFDVLTANAGILERPIDNLKQRLRLLAEFEVDRNACIKLGTCEGMWTVHIRHYEENLSFFKQLGMNVQAMSHLIRRRPRVLRQNEATMRATVEFLESIGLHGPKVLKLLEARPSILSSSVDNNLMVKFKLFQDWGFNVDNFARALSQLSQQSIEQIGLRYEFLREQGLPHEAVTKVLRMHPSIMGLPLEDLKTKMDYLLHTVNGDISDIRKFPAYLGYSFKGRIVPRFQALKYVGLRNRPCLSRILSVPTSEFKTRFNIPESVQCS